MGKINSKICRLSKKRAAYSFYICTAESNIWNLIYYCMFVHISITRAVCVCMCPSLVVSPIIYQT